MPYGMKAGTLPAKTDHLLDTLLGAPAHATSPEADNVEAYRILVCRRYGHSHATIADEIQCMLDTITKLRSRGVVL